MNTTPPIKRNKNLVWLSRDHHEGLLIVWKIRQGIRLQVNDSEILNFILHEYCHSLQPHFLQEEKWLFTSLSKKDEWRVEVEKQHAEIRKMVAVIRCSFKTREQVLQNLKVLCEKFASQLEKHIRFEERILFPYIEKIVTEEKLTEIGDELTKAHHLKMPVAWTSEFWVKHLDK